MVFYRGYKTELMPTAEQARKMIQNMGVCRFLYNEYINMNARLYRMYLRGLLDNRQKYFISAIDFDKYVNRRLKVRPEFAWIRLCGSKARKKALMNAETAYRNYFNNRSLLPNFKCRYKSRVKLYFPRNNVTDWQVQSDSVKVPTFGSVRLKERGYLPTDAQIVSGTISCCGGRFYVSLQVKEEVRRMAALSEKAEVRLSPEGFIFCNDERCNEAELFERIGQIERRLSRQRRSLGRKIKAGRYSKKIKQQHLRVERLYRRIEDIKMDYVYKLSAQILKLRPKRLVIMRHDVPDAVRRKDRGLAARKRLFYVFCEKLTHKAQLMGIEISEAGM